jgi:hypothetical protein
MLIVQRLELHSIFLCDELKSDIHFEVRVIGQLNSNCLLVSCQLMRVLVISS